MSCPFDNVSVGVSFKSRGRTLTEADIVMFAGLSGDFNELHTNEVYARQSRFGQRIAHGALVFSISTGLAAQMNLIHDAAMAFCRIDNLRFVNPAYVGDTVHVTKQLVDKKEAPGGQRLITFKTTVSNQNGETVIEYQDKLLIKESENSGKPNEL
jgi:3-hydroxybutyryl-CoA dehydratase